MILTSNTDPIAAIPTYLHFRECDMALMVQDNLSNHFHSNSTRHERQLEYKIFVFAARRAF